MKKIQRRQIAAVAMAIAGLGLGGTAALAQGGYPAKTITMIVPAAAGGTTDLAARMAAQALAPVIGQSVVVDNKGGGNGSIAASLVKRAEADGYTLLMQYSGYHVISPHLTKARIWEQGDFQPVANVLSAPQIIVVRSELPVKTLAELVAYAKANPGKLNYASSGNGSLQHVTGAMLEQQAGIKMVHVPYKGTGPALQDLLGGQVDLTFGTAPPFMPHVQSGKLRVLAVTGTQRLPSLPDAPTTAEAGYAGVNATSWFAVFAPAATPKPVIDKLTADLKKVVENPAFKQKAQEQGATADYMNPQQLGAMVKTEWSNWAQVVKSSKIEAE
ncbi:tripartite tricarboxylate transporter receptor family protein [Delftia acidovorans]|jgi:tripartite-type tricarboxylate transporter receptor subunit TctC|uniref:Bug family tripartite tricarboxylate transporter substrate binding protein n=1 Tax=Delftia TaxID=80865 RepID=UPI000503384F|nr:MULTISPECIES: tripartite tricarboxylate transporter substrate binding protein [Delftia]ATH14771.1 tripartite tricarboxylate transporter substrate binding protein [Delftia acidovorans]KFJ09915.1 tripartite tricarboxylate transporter receptor family protein [Delftia acidovorans]MBD9583622.1 tripartite tricarboxylate transporter substrate binding protein [Delftia sp. DLF01]MBJ2140311.1 tripartite tricarboxylate transporter substrate binding protein [Delftia acidovorans]QQB52230.1 tripartite tr